MNRTASLTILLAVAGAAVLGLLQCSPRQELPPSVVLVVLDTSRADRFGSYGYQRETTPFLDRLAGQGVRFTRAYSTSCWTLPSHASMFTGLYPFSHGATQEHLYLEDSCLTLAERFAAQGYQTVAFSANPLVGSSTNLSQGFQTFHEVWKMERTKKITRWGDSYPHRVNYELRRWWKQERNREKPLFLFINYLDTHAPYRPPDRQALLMLEERELAAARALPQRWTDYFLGRIVYDALAFRLLSSLYDAELRRLDEAMEDVAGLLEREGMMDNTVLVVTSDHGENLGEHGLVDHVFSLYNTTLHIPLIMVHRELFPAGATCDAPVVISDIFPTLVQACGLESEGEPGHAIPLLPEQWERIDRDRPLLSEYGYPQQALGAFRQRDRDLSVLDRYRRSLRSLIRGDYKLIVGSDQISELYHLSSDPGEYDNLIESMPEVGQALRGGMEALLEELPSAGERSAVPEFSPATRERLRVLGYVE